MSIRFLVITNSTLIGYELFFRGIDQQRIETSLFFVTNTIGIAAATAAVVSTTKTTKNN